MELNEKAVDKSGLYIVGGHLKREHLNLTSYSRMNVRLAAQVCTYVWSSYLIAMHFQVLSKTVAEGFKTMRELKLTTTDTVETEKFCRTFNKFFDICNARSTKESQIKKNLDIDPFYSVDDPRLQVKLSVV